MGPRVGATFKVEAAAVVRTEEEEEMEMEEAAVAGREGRGVALMSRHTHTSSEVTCREEGRGVDELWVRHRSLLTQT